MATTPSPSSETLDPNPGKSDPETLDPSTLPPPSSTPPPAAAAPAASPAPSPSPSPAPAAAPADNPNPNPNPTPTPPNPSPNPNPNPTLVAPPPPSIPSFTPSFTPSFRPLGAPPALQYSTYPNTSYPMAPSPGIQPPGVSNPGFSMVFPGASSGVGSVTVSMPPMRHPYMYPGAPGQPPASAPMMYGQAPNGYMTIPGAPQQQMHPPGIARYPAPYPTLIRPGFPPRPMPPIGVIPQLPRPIVPGVRALVPPVVRPVVPIVAPPEKPHTTVYVGKIAPTIDNEFLLSLLRLCGPVKSWKRAQDPSDGTPKGFGFCEFESAEGILRAMRLLSKLNLDGQELVLNINLATRQYLERYVEKKIEREKLKETEAQVTEHESAPGIEKQEPHKPALEDAKKDSEGPGDKENNGKAQEFGIVTDEERDADRDALEKITNMIEERLKTNPLPPPPLVNTLVDGSAKSNSDVPSKSRDGDSDVDIMKSDAAEDKNDDETTSENKLAFENGRREMRTPDRRRHDMSIREREREFELKREKDRLDRSERDREKERDRRERNKKDEFEARTRRYREQLLTWEAHEREREHWCQKERDVEKENYKKRRREILKDELESYADDDARKRRRRSAYDEEKRRKRLREKEDDFADRLKEEQEIAEAKRRAIEEQLPKDDLNIPMTNDIDKPITKESELSVEERENATEDGPESVSVNDINTGDGSTDEQAVGLATVPDKKHNSIIPTRKLGFGLISSGKRTTVPSVFHEEDDEDVDEKKMRPLVPIDYSTEELQAVQPSVSVPSSNLAAAAEFAKRISGVNTKEEKTEIGRERNGRSSDRSNLRDRDRNDDDSTRARNENKEKMHDKVFDREDKPKTETKKLFDAKQLIDMIPKTKEELFAYDINWTIYDKHGLDERMRPWISKKITEFLGEEEPTLVDYIVTSTKDHVQASKMLELLQSIFDDEAEMFVLKMWRTLIFEIKKVETGLSAKSRG